LAGITELAGKKTFTLQYPHPDGTRVAKLTDASSWAELLALAGALPLLSQLPFWREFVGRSLLWAFSSLSRGALTLVLSLLWRRGICFCPLCMIIIIIRRRRRRRRRRIRIRIIIMIIIIIMISGFAFALLAADPEWDLDGFIEVEIA